MFSGIIEVVGNVQSIQSGADGARLSIAAGSLLDGVRLGDSIAVNGACLTVVTFSGSTFDADVSPETLRRTNLGSLQSGDFVNLERALALGDRLGGHLVTGHIDGLGRIRSRRSDGDSIWLTVEGPPEVMRYIVQKGSVAVDGISLTVVDADEDSFTVALIPHTLEITTLGVRQVGDEINLETDVLAKYVQRSLGFAEQDA